ncbi:MAG: hypothetical protein KAS66_09005 [Candidatus Omnitrophica bacterium]|nr:hypothetical protein [Candidatus Omnitrophota bacterium]
MSEIVEIETDTTKLKFTSSGGFETAVRDFLAKRPDNSTGTVNIRGDKRMWFKSGDEIIIGKPTKSNGMLSEGTPVCPDCGAYLDRTAKEDLCKVCASLVRITKIKKGNQYFTEIIKP